MFELKKEIEEIASPDLYYDILEEYLSPDKFLLNKEDCDKVNEAISVVKDYMETIAPVVEEI